MQAIPTLDNAAVAAHLDEYAALLELANASYYTSRAYRRAAETIRAMTVPVMPLVANGRARDLRGIGASIESRLRELAETGEIAEVQELRRTVSVELAALGRNIGIGARRGTQIGRALGIETADEFRAAAEAGRLREVPGIGRKTEARILAALAAGPETPAPRPLLLPEARALVESIAAGLDGVAAGDPRRWKDSSTELAVVVVSDDAPATRERFAGLPEIVTLATPDVGITVEGVPITLVVAARDSFGTALVQATGSREYVEALGPLPAGRDEDAVFQALGIPFVPPELREGTPSTDFPPQLVTLEQIRGDLHCHTTWSDGKASVLEMGQAARARGYDYLAICDHTPNVTVVPGLDADALQRQGDEIAEANEQLAPFWLLRGTECDIRADGSLDFPDAILDELDWVQLSLHAGQRASRRDLTTRVTDAMRHPAVRCLSHPTGRLIGHRPENDLDLEETIRVALEHDVALEVNGLANRLDLKGGYVRLVVEAGATIVCSTDAHSVRGLDNMELAVRTARRGGATPRDVVNSRPLEAILRHA